ncbi:unnamed protein product [Caenorhabditis sp. 36 PRJEB53466]|nr:unnamed protein product [Caenorhabditis sp. 36 PRJEB53466]
MTEEKGHVLRMLSILLLAGVYQCSAQYVVDIVKMTSFGEEELVHKCAATGGNFGKDVSDFIVSDENLGCGATVDPVDACGPVTISRNHTKGCHNMFALVSRSNIKHPCKFSHQAYMVQNSTMFPPFYPFRLVIFYNYAGQDPISMEGSDIPDRVNIPVLMISYACKEEIMRKFLDSAGYRLRIRIDPGYYELFRYLIPFLVVIVFCFALFLITLCVRGCVERRKLNKRRLSKRNLKKIPVKKYRLGDEPDTCAICLESFSQGEKLRHLPCRHVFHCKCIDVWLTQTRKVCPLCKRKIGSDSDSDCSTSDLTSHQDDTLYGNVEVHQGFEELPAIPTRPFDDLWSSQEALVDEDLVLTGNSRRTFTERVRNFINRVMNDSEREDQGNPVGLENNAYLVRQQSGTNDGNHLLENEVFAPTSDHATVPSTSNSNEITLA